MKKLICAVTVLAISTAQANTIHVDDDNCPGPGDGSELGPYCSIQTAIDNAVDTDEIVVAPGTYFETINFLGKAITVRSTDPMVVVNTVIDGTGINSSVVLCVSGEGPGTVLSGFFITGGNNTVGGGMLNTGSSPTVTNCTFSGNTAIAGGGMLNFNGSSPMVTNCTFSGNSADDGGAIANVSSIPTVTDCTFCDNDPDDISGTYADGGGNNFVCPCPADIDGDGDVGINDFLALLAAWGPNPGHPADFDGDGIVGITDFLLLLANWGTCP